jgi:hypothetical protein
MLVGTICSTSLEEFKPRELLAFELIGVPTVRAGWEVASPHDYTSTAKKATVL